MPRFMCLLFCFLTAGFLAAGALPAQTTPAHDWDELQRLKTGTRGDLLDVILFPREPGGTVSEQRCRLLAVTPASLTCIETYSRTQRLVFPQTAVAAVYRIKTGTSFSIPKLVLAAGAGFTLGCLVTDDRCNIDFAVLGTAIGALNGLRWGARPSPAKFVCVYQSSPRPAPLAWSAATP